MGHAQFRLECRFYFTLFVLRILRIDVHVKFRTLILFMWVIIYLQILMINGGSMELISFLVTVNGFLKNRNKVLKWVETRTTFIKV